MAKIKPEKAYAKEIFQEFHGMREGQTIGTSAANEIRNFRILSDGSLQKRCGWEAQIALPGTVRGFWKGSLQNRSYCFAVSDSQVYLIDGPTGSQVATLDSQSGRVRFFVYRGYLYLMDGSSVLVYNSAANSFEVPVGYAPLYGYNWHPTNMGTVNEPLNLLSNHLRVHYLNTTGSNTFQLPYYADSINQVRVDGRLTTDYTLHGTGKSFTITTASVGGSVEVAFSVSLSNELRDQLLQTTCSFVKHEDLHERLLLYGTSQGNRLFCATEIDDNSLNASKAIWSNSDPLYFTQSSVLMLGDASHPITSLFCNHGRILAFHKDGAYSVAFANDGNGIESYPLLYGLGCEASDAELYLDNDPVIVNSGGIFRIHSSAGDPDTFETTCLSEKLPALRGSNFAANAQACYDVVHGELWFLNQIDGLIWVYSIAAREWTVFDNVEPSFFFGIGCDVGFASGSLICAFNESLSTDRGMPFTALYRTGLLSFGYPEALKRSLRFSLTAHTAKNELTAEIEGESLQKSFSVKGANTELAELIDRRVAIGRFHFLRVTLRDGGSGRSRIYRLALYANL